MDSPVPIPVDSQIDISLVIVSFNTRDVLRESLESVAREQGSLRLEIFVVDNNSQDDSVAMVEAGFPHVRVIRSRVNLGFGAANNAALELARGKYVVLLNSDAFLCPRSLELLPADGWSVAISPCSHPRVCFPVSFLISSY